MTTTKQENETQDSEGRPRIPPPSVCNNFYCVYLSTKLLRQHSPETRHQMILDELFKRLDLALGIDPIKTLPTERLADLGLVGTSAGRFARTINIYFPWVTAEAALSMILSCPTVDTLASAINHKV